MIALRNAVVAGILLTVGHRTTAVPLVLNDLRFTVDSATWRDIVASTFMSSRFAAHYGGDQLHGPVIFIGKYNYFEIAPARGDSASVSITLADEQPGTWQQLVRTMGMQPFRLKTESPAGFDAGATEMLVANPPMQTRFAVLQRTATTPAADSLPDRGISNAGFLARYFDSARLFESLRGATVAMPLDDISRIADLVRRDSVPVHLEANATVIEFSGFTLRLIPPWTGAGVKRLEFALTHEVPANPVYRFGLHSQFRFGPGPMAVWDFSGR